MSESSVVPCLMLEPLQQNQVRYLEDQDLFLKLYILLEEVVSS